MGMGFAAREEYSTLLSVSVERQPGREGEEDEVAKMAGAGECVDVDVIKMREHAPCAPMNLLKSRGQCARLAATRVSSLLLSSIPFRQFSRTRLSVRILLKNPLKHGTVCQLPMYEDDRRDKRVAITLELPWLAFQNVQ